MKIKHVKLAVMLILLVSLLTAVATAAPNGVTITPLSNTTATPVDGGLINTTGGSITVLSLNGTTQNVRWKAFVGNVSGSLTLNDANNNTIYDWDLTAISGEVYATRFGGTVNWTGINCAPLNATESENINLSHTSPDDNITATFDGLDNQEIFVGTTRISPNTCQTTNLYQNSTDPSATTDAFEEVVLYDRGNSSWDQNQTSFGNIIYTQTLQQDTFGYDNTSTFDFQLIVPEVGLETWTSSTAYYFYIELS